MTNLFQALVRTNLQKELYTTKKKVQEDKEKYKNNDTPNAATDDTKAKKDESQNDDETTNDLDDAAIGNTNDQEDVKIPTTGDKQLDEEIKNRFAEAEKLETKKQREQKKLEILEDLFSNEIEAAEAFFKKFFKEEDFDAYDHKKHFLERIQEGGMDAIYKIKYELSKVAELSETLLAISNQSFEFEDREDFLDKLLNASGDFALVHQFNMNVTMLQKMGVLEENRIFDMFDPEMIHFNIAFAEEANRIIMGEAYMAYQPSLTISKGGDTTNYVIDERDKIAAIEAKKANPELDIDPEKVPSKIYKENGAITRNPSWKASVDESKMGLVGTDDTAVIEGTIKSGFALFSTETQYSFTFAQATAAHYVNERVLAIEDKIAALKADPALVAAKEQTVTKDGVRVYPSTALVSPHREAIKKLEENLADLKAKDSYKDYEIIQQLGYTIKATTYCNWGFGERLSIYNPDLTDDYIEEVISLSTAPAKLANKEIDGFVKTKGPEFAALWAKLSGLSMGITAPNMGVPGHVSAFWDVHRYKDSNDNFYYDYTFANVGANSYFYGIPPSWGDDLWESGNIDFYIFTNERSY